MIGLSNCSNQGSTKLPRKKMKCLYSIQPKYVIKNKKWNQEYCKVRIYLWFETLCVGLNKKWNQEYCKLNRRLKPIAWHRVSKWNCVLAKWALLFLGN